MKVKGDLENKRDERWSEFYDYGVMKFVVRHKIVSYSQIACEFSDVANVNAVYFRVNLLLKKGYLEYEYLKEFKNFGIVISKKGYKIVRENSYDPIPKNPVRAQAPSHDFIVNAFLIGLHRLHRNTIVYAFTEFELMTTPMDWYPMPIPATAVHRPDGYLLYGENTGDKIVALEIEWSRKTKSRYETLADFYESHKNVHVVWIVKTRTIAKNIAKAFGKRESLKNRYAIFEWEKLNAQGWSAPCTVGPFQNATLINLFSEYDLNNDRIIPKTLSLDFILCVKRTIKKSKTSLQSNETPNRVSGGLGDKTYPHTENVQASEEK